MACLEIRSRKCANCNTAAPQLNQKQTSKAQRTQRKQVARKTCAALIQHRSDELLLPPKAAPSVAARARRPCWYAEHLEKFFEALRYVRWKLTLTSNCARTVQWLRRAAVCDRRSGRRRQDPPDAGVRGCVRREAGRAQELRREGIQIPAAGPRVRERLPGSESNKLLTRKEGKTLVFFGRFGCNRKWESHQADC